MKIIGISTTPLRAPLKNPFHMSNFSVYDMHYVLIRVETDTGIIGYGEATPSWDINGETPESIEGFVHLITNVKMLGYTLIGEAIDTLDQINTLIDTVINPLDQFSYIAENTAAKAALEQALYSAYSQAQKISLFDAFNIKLKSIPFTHTISVLPIKDTVQKAINIIKDGGSIIRLKIGKKHAFGLDNYQRDIQVIKTISDLIGNKEVKLIADANQGFVTVKETLQFCKQIGNRLAWLEQPILGNDLLGFKEIKKRTTTALMADESITSYKDLKILLQLKAVDFINIKLMKTGGYRGALAFIDLASRYGVKVHIGSMIESAYGIYMGLLLALARPEIVSTDLNVYDLLEKQYCTYSYKQINNQITDIKEMPIINPKSLQTIIKNYGYKGNS